MKRSIEDQIKLNLIEEEGIIGVPNTRLIEQAKAENQLFRNVWDKPVEGNEGFVNTLWKIVQGMIGWRGG